MKKEILSEELDPTALLNKKLADVAKSNLSRDMWFIKAPTWEGCFLADEENNGNFSYWSLYNQDDEHKGTISVENGIITQLPRNLSESKKIKKEILSEQFKRMQKLAGILNEGNIGPTRARTWHANYSEALDKALEFGKAKGYTYNNDEIKELEKFQKTLNGPNPNSASVLKLTLNKDGKETDKMLEINIYNAGDKDPKEKYTLSCSIYTKTALDIQIDRKNRAADNNRPNI